MWKIREIQDKVTNVVMNYTVVESKVREATNDDQWGPHGTVMSELAKYTFTYEHFPEVMGMLWKRMLYEQKYWRRIYKCLLLLNYLIRNGSERVITSARDHLHDMRQLETYQHIDEFGKDQGLNVRHKVKELLEVIQDDSRLREERKRAKVTKDKYIGMSSDVIEDAFYSDRYSKEPSSYGYSQGGGGGGSGGGSGGGNGNGSQYNEPKSKFQQFKDSIDSIRPGKRDYAEYNDNEGKYDSYRDEPDPTDEGEEVHEDSDGEDSFKYISTKKGDEPEEEKTEEKKKSPARKIDLGAAANLVAFSAPSPNSTISEKKEEPPIADFADFQSTNATSASAFDDLADVLTAPVQQPSLISTSNDLFANFSEPASSQPAKPVDDFANFESFESLNAPASTTTNASLFDDFDSLSSTSTSQMSNGTINLMQPQPSMQPNLMQTTMMMPQTQNSMQPINVMQPMSMAQPNTMMMFQNQNNMYQSTNQMMNQTNSNAPRYSNSTNKISNTPSKSTMWSGTGVDISLDSLTPGGGQNKNPMPSMNQLAGQAPRQPQPQPQPQQQQGFYNMQQQQQQMQPNMMMMNNNMGNMNLGMSNGRMPVQSSMGMRPNMNMQMNMSQPMMNQTQMSMGMNMNAHNMRPQGFSQFNTS